MKLHPHRQEPFTIIKYKGNEYFVEVLVKLSKIPITRVIIKVFPYSILSMRGHRHCLKLFEFLHSFKRVANKKLAFIVAKKTISEE